MFPLLCIYFKCICDCMCGCVHLCKLTSLWTKQQKQKIKNTKILVHIQIHLRWTIFFILILCIQYICRSDLGKLAWHSNCGFIYVLCSLYSIAISLRCIVDCFNFRLWNPSGSNHWDGNSDGIDSGNFHTISSDSIWI